MNISKLDFYFKHPSTIIVSGPTQSGKTFFVKKVLEQQLITPFPTRIVWVFKRWQPNYDEIKLMLPNTEFVQGYSDNLDEYFDPLENNLLIIDDQMEQAGSSKTLSSLFTVGSHHLNLSVIYLVQNQFDKGKAADQLD
jgi:predicted AAA+ superfamily ATPase